MHNRYGRPIDVQVALRKESVDRNVLLLLFWSISRWSLSARRAWIEILAYPDMIICTNVALRKESVDRNCYAGDCTATQTAVALRKESVDRNSNVKWKIVAAYGRSPQGERG